MAPSGRKIAEAAEAVNRSFRKWDNNGSGFISLHALCKVLGDIGLGREVADLFISEVKCISYQLFVDWAFGLNASDSGPGKAGLSDTKQVKIVSVLAPGDTLAYRSDLGERLGDFKAKPLLQSTAMLGAEFDKLKADLNMPILENSGFDETVMPDRTLNPSQAQSSRQFCPAKDLFSTTRGSKGIKSLQLSASALESTMSFQGSRAGSIKDETLSALDSVHGTHITWTRGDLIGSGSMGNVFQALNQKNGEILAVKEVRIDEGQTTDRKFRLELENEISIIKDLRHPRIVSYLGSDYVDSNLYVYLEFMPGGSLAQVIQEFGALEESLFSSYTRDAVEGVAYLHSREPPVLHRDIKGANMLLSMDCRVKLTDFGCSKRMEDTKSKTMRGSIPWMAPEVIMSKGAGRPADVWSLGCVVIEMATAKLPWGGFDNHMAAVYKIGMSKQEIPIPDSLSSGAQEFIVRCTQRDQSKRPSAEDLLNLEFLGALLVTSLSETFA